MAPWDSSHLLLRIGLQAKKIDLSKAPNSNIVFLIDVSGSMYDQNKLPLLKSSLKMLLGKLKAEDKVSIVTYASGTAVALKPTSVREREQIEKVLSFKDQWQWISYVSVPLLLLIKISVTAVLIDVGCVFYNEKLPYKQLFRIVLLGEFIFLAVPIFKLCWFLFFQPNFSLEDIQYFYPLSALNIIGYKGVAVWFIYPLQLLNLFEVVYWFLISVQLNKAIGSTTGKGVNIVASGYGVGLLLWVVCVMFFTLNMS